MMKIYESESVLASMVGPVDEKTFRKWAWAFVVAISDLQDSVVSYPLSTMALVLVSIC